MMIGCSLLGLILYKIRFCLIGLVGIHVLYKLSHASVRPLQKRLKQGFAGKNHYLKVNP